MGKREFYIACLWLTYNLMDIVFTHWGLERGHVELNPFGSAVIAGHGEGWLYVIKLTVTLLLIPLIARLGKQHPSAWTYLRMWNLVLCGVVLWNVATVLG